MTPASERITRTNIERLERLGPLAEAREPQQLLAWNRQRQELTAAIDEIARWLAWLGERTGRSRALMARQHEQARDQLRAGREDACRQALRRKCELRRLIALDEAQGRVLTEEHSQLLDERRRIDARLLAGAAPPEVRAARDPDPPPREDATRALQVQLDQIQRHRSGEARAK